MIHINNVLTDNHLSGDIMAYPGIFDEDKKKFFFESNQEEVNYQERWYSLMTEVTYSFSFHGKKFQGSCKAAQIYGIPYPLKKFHPQKTVYLIVLRHNGFELYFF